MIQNSTTPVQKTLSPFNLERNPIWESTAVNTPSELASPVPEAFGSPVAQNEPRTAIRGLASRILDTKMKSRQPLGLLSARQTNRTNSTEALLATPSPRPFHFHQSTPSPNAYPSSAKSRDASVLSPSESDRMREGIARLSAAFADLDPAVSSFASVDAFLEAMDVDCRILVGGVPTECAARALKEFTIAANRKRIRNPSGFLVRLVTTAVAEDNRALRMRQAEGQGQASPSSDSAAANEALMSTPLPSKPLRRVDTAEGDVGARPPGSHDGERRDSNGLEERVPLTVSPTGVRKLRTAEEGEGPRVSGAGQDKENQAAPLPPPARYLATPVSALRTPFNLKAPASPIPYGGMRAEGEVLTPSRMAPRSPFVDPTARGLSRDDIQDAVRAAEGKYSVSLQLDVRALNSLQGLTPLAVTACLENVAVAVSSGKCRNPSALLGTQAAKYHKDGAKASIESSYMKSPSQLIAEGLQALTPELRDRIEEVTGGKVHGLRIEYFDAAVLTSLESLPLSGALEVLNFATSVQWRKVRNPSGFLMGLIRGKHAELKAGTPSPLR